MGRPPWRLGRSRYCSTAGNHVPGPPSGNVIGTISWAVLEPSPGRFGPSRSRVAGPVLCLSSSSSSSATPRSLTSHPPKHRSSSKSDVAGGWQEERRDLDDGSAVRNHVPGKRSGYMVGRASWALRKEQIPLEGGPAAGNHVPGPRSGNMSTTVSGKPSGRFWREGVGPSWSPPEGVLCRLGPSRGNFLRPLVP